MENLTESEKSINDSNITDLSNVVENVHLNVSEEDHLNLNQPSADENLQSSEEEEEEQEYTEQEIAEAKEHLLKIFTNEAVLNDVALRVKMQNHGAWVPFAFIASSYSVFKNASSDLIERCVEELPEIFEIKDKKFRRKEMLPDLENIVYQRSLILLSKIGDLEYTDVKDMIKEILNTHDILEGAHFRLVRPSEKNYPRDVGMLLKRCYDSIKSNCFAWIELRPDRDVKTAYDILMADENAPWTEKFELKILTKLISSQKSSRRSDTSRHRGVTVSGVEATSSQFSNGGASGTGSGGGRSIGTSRFQFNKSRNGSTNELDWAALRHGGARITASGGVAAANIINTSSANRSKPGHHLLDLPTASSGDTGQSSTTTQSRRRQRLAHSESLAGNTSLGVLLADSLGGCLNPGSGGGAGLSGSPANESSADQATRPHFVLAAGCLGARSAEIGAAANQPPGPPLVTLVRQPRGPQSGACGFQRFAPQLETIAS